MSVNLDADSASAASLETLTADPYPIYAALRRDRPVAWMNALDMWYVTRHADVREVLLNTSDFVTGTDDSLVTATFGEQMLTTEGDLHSHYRDTATNTAFMPTAVGARYRARIDARVQRLLDDLAHAHEVDLRTAFAARLPIQVMFDVFGLPDADEAQFRAWYDHFEAAMANHLHDPDVRAAAQRDVQAFRVHFQKRIHQVRQRPDDSLLAGWLRMPPERRMRYDEMCRNASIIFFGGISTVEAIILNTLWLLFQHPDVLARVQADTALAAAAVDEALRLRAPVQSATRHALVDTQVRGIPIAAGAIVNCMVASANRDASVFTEPDRFDIDRTNQRQQLGFAIGPHHCLGRHLASAEAQAAVSALLERAVDLQLLDDAQPTGHEFHQPRSMRVRWGRMR